MRKKAILFPLIPAFSAIALALPNHMDVVNVENAEAFFHLLTYIHVGIPQGGKNPSTKLCGIG
jgi:hypothetical protein